MSDRKIIVEADDLTIMQGEKEKRYYAKLYYDDGNPVIQGFVRFTFYNKDYSFSKWVLAEVGFAYIPLSLDGGSWKVDIFGLKNESDGSTLTDMVTKDITVQKFDRLGTYMESVNYHINEDDVIDNDTGYYTVYLKDENEFPVVDEPISFNISSTEQEADDVDFILKTDDDGKIEVPYLTHNDTVVIKAKYKGCTRYSQSETTDIVSFDNISSRTEVFFRADNNLLQIRKGNGVWENISEAEDSVERCIVNYPNDERTVHDGIIYYISMNSNTYQITLFYKGNDYYYSKTQTIEFVKTNDTRLSLNQWIELQGGDVSDSVAVTVSNEDDGCYSKVTMDCNFELPQEFVYLGAEEKIYPQEPSQDYYLVSKKIPTYEFKQGKMHTIVEFDINLPKSDNYDALHPPIIHLFFYIEPNDYIDNKTTPNADIVVAYEHFRKTINSFSTTQATTITVTGFGANNSSYQELEINAVNEGLGTYERPNEYYIMKLTNNDTFEEFFFYSYLIDNVTPILSQFRLGLGDWDMELVTVEGDAPSSFYTANATIDNESIYEHTDDFFYNIDNWNSYGDGSVTIENETIYAPSLNTFIALTDEYTDSNNYTLYFNVSTGDGVVLVGATSTLQDGLFIKKGTVEVMKNGQVIESNIIGDDITGQWKIVRRLNKWEIYYNNSLIHTTDELYFNNFGLWNGETVVYGLLVEDNPVADITPSVDDYDGSVFGSNLHLEVGDDTLDLTDYGMLPSGAVSGAKTIVDDVPFSANDLELELEIKYNNVRFDRLENLTGEMQMRVYEDISTKDYATESDGGKIFAREYANLLCSPMPVQNVQTVFTRHSDEGILYYVKDPKVTDKTQSSPSYLCNAYNQYKGGTEMLTETGIYLFNLDNAFSPVFIGNDLVRAEFHRRSGYVKLARYDENTGEWYVVNILKIESKPNLTKVTHNDDYTEVKFGATTWKFYRGRPFIVVNHKNDDLRVLNLVDRIYAETYENDRGIGFIEEYDTSEYVSVDDGDRVYGYSVFNPQVSIQQFKQELHIGQNIRTDNFELYDIDADKNLLDPNEESTLGTVTIDNESALLVNNNTGKLALNFPSYSNYVKRVGDTFSLLIADVRSNGETSFTIKARGFDSQGAIFRKEGIQYGIWEQSVDVEVDGNGESDIIRATFTNCPKEVKYIDFVIYFNTNSSSTVTFKEFMYYDGASQINYTKDTSLKYAEKIEIKFNDTYFANLYNENDLFGLCIMRPNQKPISLKKIPKSDETVFAPYMKKATEWDKPSQVFLEYLNSTRQIIDIDFEN